MHTNITIISDEILASYYTMIFPSRTPYTSHINDFMHCLKHTTPRTFAVDTILTACGKSIDEIKIGLNEDLESIRLWLQANKLSLNVSKTEYMLIGSLPKLPFEPKYILWAIRSKESKILGVYIDESLMRRNHIEEIKKYYWKN